MAQSRPEESPSYLNYHVSKSRSSSQLLLQVLQTQPLVVRIRATGYSRMPLQFDDLRTD